MRFVAPQFNPAGKLETPWGTGTWGLAGGGASSR
jgi:hypothetical protein